MVNDESAEVSPTITKNIKNIEKEDAFEEIVEDYYTLTGVSEDFIEIPIDSIYVDENNSMLFSFNLLDRIRGFITPKNSDIDHLFVYSILEERDSEIVLLNLNENFQEGVVQINKEEIPVDIIWENQIDKEITKVSGEDRTKLTENSKRLTYFYRNKNEENSVEATIDDVNSTPSGDKIELSVYWYDIELIWTIPTPTNEKGGKSSEFISEYGGITLLEDSTVYIKPESGINDSSIDYFIDTTSNWALLSKEEFHKYKNGIRGDTYKSSNTPHFKYLFHSLFLLGVSEMAPGIISSTLFGSENVKTEFISVSLNIVETMGHMLQLIAISMFVFVIGETVLYIILNNNDEI